MSFTLGQLAVIANALERHAPHAEKLRAVIEAMLAAKRAETPSTTEEPQP